MRLSRIIAIGTTSFFSLGMFTTVAFAASDTSEAAVLDPVACSSALDAQTAAVLTKMDAVSAAHKAALQQRTADLKAALKLTDTAARKTAMKDAEKKFHETMKASMEKDKEAMKTEKDAFKTACPGLGRMFAPMGGPMMMKKGHKGFDNEEKRGGFMKFFNRFHDKDKTEQK